MAEGSVCDELYVPGRLDRIQPGLERKLKQNGISSVKEALYGVDNVYLISSFDRGTEYLTELYENVSCEEVDKIAGFTVYKLQIL